MHQLACLAFMNIACKLNDKLDDNYIDFGETHHTQYLILATHEILGNF